MAANVIPAIMSVLFVPERTADDRLWVHAQMRAAARRHRI